MRTRYRELLNCMRDYQPSRDLLAGRVILVTGAGDGLGRSASLAYARHGASVILVGRTQQKLEAVYDEILAEQLASPLLMPLDLAKAGLREFEQIAAAIEREFGRLDGLLRMRRTPASHPLALYDLETWQKVMRSFNAAYLLTRACLGVLEKSPDASVVFTTSEMARQGRAYWGAYAAAGAALENLAQVWADELSTNTPIRMNTLDPGAVRTALRAHAYPGENPLTLRAPEDVMSLYLYLMGPDSRGTTGQALRC
jgi:NAD(P)-dependent dehydrogenase (short-subunit alcohol dehydrogenase family)